MDHMRKNALSCSSSASVTPMVGGAVLPSSLPLRRKVTARLIGINQLAAPVEQRRRDLKRTGIDPQREGALAPPGASTRTDSSSLAERYYPPTPPQREKQPL